MNKLREKAQNKILTFHGTVASIVLSEKIKLVHGETMFLSFCWKCIDNGLFFEKP